MVFSHHVTLRYFLDQPKLNLRQVRWKEFLQYFDVEIVYKPGSQQQFTDALSKPPSVATISCLVPKEWRDKLGTVVKR
jgi:hypothetical protein